MSEEFTEDDFQQLVYLVKESWGFCKSCGKWDDLRMGYCFPCVDAACPDDKVEQ